jgi:methylenetetrahydrofolate dehydrogenase (NADP+)/methenyltetrahydrofolate cyclohydrolase
MAAGVPGLLKVDMIHVGTTVIDVWFTVIDGKIHGDADFGTIEMVGNRITPVPGWVGVMTVAMLMENTFKAAKQQNS